MLCLVPRRGNIIQANYQEVHVCMKRSDKQTRFLSKQLSQFLLLSSHSQSSVSRISFNVNVPGKCHCMANFMDRYSQRLRLVSYFSEKQAGLSQKPITAFHRSGYPSIILSLVQTYGGSIVALGSWQPKLVGRKVSIVACLWIVLIFKFEFFKTSLWISHIEILINSFASLRHHSVTKVWKTFLILVTFRTETSNKYKCFRNFVRITPFVLGNYWLHFFR